ncbi:MAG TPA: hypothetical protein PLA74_10090 [Syntrophales bacterium]|nr:hypothetical protein [Syntrophales bacterium]HPQ42887.1 hypothetical protein [Syntrophales bacterium]
MVRNSKNISIVNVIKKEPPVQPPDDFTDRVMARIDLCAPRQGVAERLRQFLMRPHDITIFRLFPEKITKGQCAFYCILVSLFYLAMGMVFLRSLEIIGSAGYQAIWLLHQPEFSFAIAIGFALLAVSFISKRPVSARSARIGILIYLGAIIINSMILQIDMRIPMVTLSLLPFTIGSIIIGGVLMNAMERYTGNFK